MTRVQSYKREKWTRNGEKLREGGGFNSLGPVKKKKKKGKDEIVQSYPGEVKRVR